MVNTYLIYFLSIIGIIILCKLFIVPLKLIAKLIINSILGLILLYVINILGSFCGFHIGINVITSVVVGIFGIPGVILLIILLFLGF